MKRRGDVFDAGVPKVATAGYGARGYPAWPQVVDMPTFQSGGFPLAGGLVPGQQVPQVPVPLPREDTRQSAILASRKKISENQEGRFEMKERMRTIMTEIDACCGCFISGPCRQYQFLDVCCCPGGFSAYTLDSQPAARGIGLSLPPDLGGHIPAIDQETDRYYMHLQDVTTIASGVRVGNLFSDDSPPKGKLRLDGDGSPPAGNCDLVIMDGSFLGGKDWIHKHTTLADKDNPAFNVYRYWSEAHQALLVAQLIVAANNLKPGGTSLLRLSMAPDLFTCGVLGCLRNVFQREIMCYKPRTCHLHRDSYYIVCRGFCPEAVARVQWVERWQRVLTLLRAKGPKQNFPPFPEWRVASKEDIMALWHYALMVYHMPLWRFRKLVMAAMDDKRLMDHMRMGRPGSRENAFTHMCGRIMGSQPCNNPTCRAAHNLSELHPFVRKAFKEPVGKLHHPDVIHLVALAPNLFMDPLLETKCEMEQKAALAQLQAMAGAFAGAGSFPLPMPDILMPPAHNGQSNMLKPFGMHPDAAAGTASASAGGGGGGGGGGVGENWLAGMHTDYTLAEMEGVEGEWVHATYNEGTGNSEFIDQLMQPGVMDAMMASGAGGPGTLPPPTLPPPLPGDQQAPLPPEGQLPLHSSNTHSPHLPSSSPLPADAQGHAAQATSAPGSAPGQTQSARGKAAPGADMPPCADADADAASLSAPGQGEKHRPLPAAQDTRATDAPRQTALGGRTGAAPGTPQPSEPLSSAAASVTTAAKGTPAGAAAAAGTMAAGPAAPPRIAGYHGRVSLVKVEIADTFSLSAVIDFLGG